MTVHKQSVSFTDAAFAFARELVEAGEYPNVSAAVSGEMARAKAARERERTLLEAEVQRRLAPRVVAVAHAQQADVTKWNGAHRHQSTEIH